MRSKGGYSSSSPAVVVVKFVGVLGRSVLLAVFTEGIRLVDEFEGASVPVVLPLSLL